MIGIYKIQNLINGKVYIGQIINIERRFHQHKYDDSQNSVIHRTIKKYGIENFSFEVIEECNYKDLDEREIFWIKYYNSSNKNNGYNLTLGGQRGQKYDYAQIFSLWQEGVNCKEIQNKMNCSDQTVSSALKCYNLTDYEIRSRSQKAKLIIAKDRLTEAPLKVFRGQKQIQKFFGDAEGKGDLCKILKNKDKKYSVYGYLWEYVEENLIDNIAPLTDEEFLSFQKYPKHTYERTNEFKEKISLQNRKVNIPSRQGLKNLIREKSILEIGRIYNVSDNTIRKWCDYYNLPRKKREIKNYSIEEWELI